MAGRINEVDQESATVFFPLLLHQGKVRVGHFKVQRDGAETLNRGNVTSDPSGLAIIWHLRGLDGYAPGLLIFPRVGTSGHAGLGPGNDAGFGQEGVGQGGLAVVDMGNHGHVADVEPLVHNGADLVDGKVHLKDVKE
jgi:hypothetical protein